MKKNRIIQMLLLVSGFMLHTNNLFSQDLAFKEVEKHVDNKLTNPEYKTWHIGERSYEQKSVSYAINDWSTCQELSNSAVKNMKNGEYDQITLPYNGTRHRLSASEKGQLILAENQYDNVTKLLFIDELPKVQDNIKISTDYIVWLDNENKTLLAAKSIKYKAAGAYAEKVVYLQEEPAQGKELSKISETINQNKIECYPNPANEVLNVKFSATHGDIITISIEDITGKKIVEKEESILSSGVNNIRLDVSELANGTYVLTLIDGDSIANQTITITKK